MTTIIQISDSHIVAENHLTCGVVDTASALRSCVETINTLPERIGPIDLVLVTGDLTEHGRPDEYAHFCAIMAGLDAPWRYIPGNHDNNTILLTLELGAQAKAQGGHFNWSQAFPDLGLIALDSSKDGEPQGQLGADSLAFLEQALADMRGLPVLVAVHHPAFITGIRPMDQQNLHNPAAFLDILRGHDAPLRLICGHLHRHYTTMLNGICCISAPGTSHSVTLDTRTDNANSLTIDPGGFLIHEVRNGDIITQQHSIGRYDGPYPFA